MNDKVNIKFSAHAEPQISSDDMVKICLAYMRSVCLGLIVTNQGVDSKIMWESMFEAMGRLGSEVTLSQDPKETLELRGIVQEKFTAALRKHAPVLGASSKIIIH